jgi:hypothetical protein
MMIPDRSSEKVTIEDLLRLKRAERPSPEFWTCFEQDLRAKQLAAIVEKRPWWHALRLPQAARAVARFQVPLGSAAVLTLSFIVVSHYHGQPVSPTGEDSPAVATSAQPVATAVAMSSSAEPVTATVAMAEPTVVAVAQPVVSEPKPVEVLTAQQAPMEVAMTSASAPVARPTELTSMIPWGLGQTAGTNDASAEQAPVSTRLIQTSLQVAATSDLGVTTLLGNALVDEGQLQASRMPVAEVKPAVAQTTSPRELRRAKILAGLVLADNADGSDYARAIHGRDVAANDLSEDQLYDSARRLGVGGDRLTLKF